MRNLSKWMLAAATCVVSASALVGCSDDDFPKNTMGSLGVNSLQTTSTTATVFWTIVSDGSCDGYKIQINEGTRENKGNVVVDQTFDNPRVATATFTGLKPNTDYVITTQAVPSASSGFTSAQTYEMHFVTAPIVENLKASQTGYKKIVTVVEDKYGNPLKGQDGNDSVVITHEITISASWNAINASNCGGYTVSAFNVATGKAEFSKVNASATANTAELVFTTKPGTVFNVGVAPRPNNACWYPSGETTFSGDFPFVIEEDEAEEE